VSVHISPELAWLAELGFDVVVVQRALDGERSIRFMLVPRLILQRNLGLFL